MNISITLLKYYKALPNISSYEDVIEINDDGSINVHADIHLYNCNLYDIPFNIKYVNGDFLLHKNNLTNLNNFPKLITGDIDLRFNKLKTLKGIENLEYHGNKINLVGNDKLRNFSHLLLVNFILEDCNLFLDGNIDSIYVTKYKKYKELYTDDQLRLILSNYNDLLKYNTEKEVKL